MQNQYQSHQLSIYLCTYNIWLYLYQSILIKHNSMPTTEVNNTDFLFITAPVSAWDVL